MAQQQYINVSGKLSDEMFMELSHKYEVERMELKDRIKDCRERLEKIGEIKQNKDDFIKVVRKFMEMDSLTAPMLRELIDHIDVYEKEGGKKNYTQCNDFAGSDRLYCLKRQVGFTLTKSRGGLSALLCPDDCKT